MDDALDKVFNHLLVMLENRGPGDSGYPLRDWWMVPYLNLKSEAQMRFNMSQSRARVKVEQTFGQLKRRFFANAIGYRMDLNNIPNCIIASCVLHNIAKQLNLPEITEEEQPITDDQPDPDIAVENLADEQIDATNIVVTWVAGLHAIADC
uniref:DDE Tnp4 domain-containing protein n=1 Tax=Globodera rostochiensis TaxID=31243 RepID=A0A914I9T4_GLORO